MSDNSASVVLAWMKETGMPHDHINVNGGCEADVTIIEVLS